MPNIRIQLLIMFLSCSIAWSCNESDTHFNTPNQKDAVQIKKVSEKYQLYKNDKPYYIKGAAIIDIKYLRDVKEHGGNSVRIYTTDNAQEILDSAFKLGLTVTIGLYLQIAVNEMDYNNTNQVEKQLLQIEKEVKKFKNHPALLMWGIGNEVGGALNGNVFNTLSYIHLLKAINNIAIMIHRVDPNHPTTTMIQSGSFKIVNLISFCCKDIDLLSCNIFGDMKDVQSQLQSRGWNKPFLISEFGAKPYWLMDRTDWYSSYEQTSDEKSAYIIREYNMMNSYKDFCLGSYVFVWNWKHENTGTLFSLFTKRGEPTAMIDAIEYLWTAKWPIEKAPSLTSLSVNFQNYNENIYIKSGSSYITQFSTIDQDVQKLVLHWEILKEGAINDLTKFSILVSGDTTYTNESSDKLQLDTSKKYNFKFTAPSLVGGYRLYLYLKKNEINKVSTGNACLYVH